MGRNCFYFSVSFFPLSHQQIEPSHFNLLKGLSTHVICSDILLPAVEWIQFKYKGSYKTFPIETRVQHKGIN